jgi:hypothetical protein
MKRLLIILLACASHALAGPNVRVSIDAQGEGSGLILQAYTACLRNTPGVQVVPLGRPADAQVEIMSAAVRDQAGAEIGYAWAIGTVDPRVSTVMFLCLCAIDQTTNKRGISLVLPLGSRARRHAGTYRIAGFDYAAGSIVISGVAMEFMTDNAAEAEEMREQMLTFNCVREVMVLDEPGWVSL